VTERFVIFSFYGYFVAFFLFEFVLTRFRLGSAGKGDKDPLTLVFFFIAPTVGMFVWISSINRHAIPAHPTWLLWGIGVICGLLGFAVRSIGKRTLGRQFTVRVQIQDQHDLVDHGIYGVIRHPLYTGALLEWMAPPFLLGSPPGFLFLTLPVLIGVLQRIPREERLLLEAFGERYRAYMGRTKRLVPGVW